MVRKDLSAHSNYGADLAREWLRVVMNRDRNMKWCRAHLGAISEIDLNSSGILLHFARIVLLKYYRHDKMALICPETIPLPDT